MQIIIVLLIISIAVLIQWFIFRRFALKNLSAHLEFSRQTAHCGDTITIDEHIRNEKNLPLSMVIIRFEAPRELLFPDMTNTSLSDYYYREDLITLGAWKEHIRHIKVICKKRGYFEFKRLSVITTDLLLISKMSMTYPTQSTLTIFPKRVKDPSLEKLFIRILGDRTQRQNPIIDPFAFSGIREYLPTDHPRTINWKASAKHSTLMVNTYISSIRPEITLLLNVSLYSPDKETSNIENAISLCYSLSLSCIQKGLPVALYSNSCDTVTQNNIQIDHGSTRPHGEHIAHALARIDLSKKEASPKILFNEKTTPLNQSRILVISPNFDTFFQKMLIEQIRNGYSMIWIIPYQKHASKPKILPELGQHTIFWSSRYE